MWNISPLMEACFLLLPTIMGTGSMIYKMDNSTGRLSFYQTLQTRGAFDLEYFSIANKHFLAVANHYDGTNRLDSTVYQWNGKLFVDFQKLSTNGANPFTYFKIYGEKYLAVANYHDGRTTSTKSVIYKWSGGKFNRFQDITTEGAFGCTAFVINGGTFIAFANYYNSQHKGLFSPVCSSGQEVTLLNCSLFRLMEHLMSCLLALTLTHSLSLPTATLEVNTTPTPSFTTGMATSSSCSSPYLLTGLSLGTHL